MAKAKTVPERVAEAVASQDLTPEEALKAEFKAKLAAVRAEQKKGVGGEAMEAAIHQVWIKTGRYPKYVSIRATVDPETGIYDPETLGTRIVVTARSKAKAAA